MLRPATLGVGATDGEPSREHGTRRAARSRGSSPARGAGPWCRPWCRRLCPEMLPDVPGHGGTDDIRAGQAVVRAPGCTRMYRVRQEFKSPLGHTLVAHLPRLSGRGRVEALPAPVRGVDAAAGWLLRPRTGSGSRDRPVITPVVPPPAGAPGRGPTYGGDGAAAGGSAAAGPVARLRSGGSSPGDGVRAVGGGRPGPAGRPRGVAGTGLGAGTRLQLRVAGGLVVVDADPGGAFAVTRQGTCGSRPRSGTGAGLAAGDRLLLASDPALGRLVVYPPAALDRVTAELDAATLAGDGAS